MSAGYPQTNIEGEVVVGPPYQIQCRWIWKRSQAMDSQGNVQAIDVTVITAQEVFVGSKLLLGVLEDWVGTGTGTDEDGMEMMEVVSYDETPDEKRQCVRRQLACKKFRGNLPTMP